MSITRSWERTKYPESRPILRGKNLNHRTEGSDHDNLNSFINNKISGGGRTRYFGYPDVMQYEVYNIIYDAFKLQMFTVTLSSFRSNSEFTENSEVRETN